jgi:flagellar export protein FliJ
MTFAFNLEPVLAYRKVVEENEQQKLQSIEAMLQKALQLKSNLLAETSNYARMLAPPSGGTIDVHLFKNVASYLNKLNADVLRLVRIIAKLEEDKNVQLGKLIQAKRSREIVENLKKKKLTMHQKELNVMEQKLLDELAAERFCQATEQFLPTEGAD